MIRIVFRNRAEPFGEAGLARARRGVASIGAPEVLEAAIGRPVQRWPGLEERLR